MIPTALCLCMLLLHKVFVRYIFNGHISLDKLASPEMARGRSSCIIDLGVLYTISCDVRIKKNTYSIPYLNKLLYLLVFIYKFNLFALLFNLAP